MTTHPWPKVAFLFASLAFICGSTSAQPIHYASPYSILEYDYTTVTDPMNDDLATLEVDTQYGAIKADFDYPSFDIERVTISHAVSATSLSVTFVSRKDPSIRDIHLWIENYGDVYFTSNENTGEVQYVARSSTDCSSIQAVGAWFATVEAMSLISHDYEQYTDESRPDHLNQAAATTSLVGVLPYWIGDCLQLDEPAAGPCYFGTPTYPACVECCQNEIGIGHVVCAVIAVCPHPICKRAKTLVCGGAIPLQRALCVVHSCAGKPGDPNCPDPKPPCPGTCYGSFCGIGKSPLCGDCFGLGECCG